MFNFKKKERINNNAIDTINASMRDLIAGNKANTEDYTGITELAQIDNALALRVINKLASYIYGDGFQVDFGDEKTNKEFQDFVTQFDFDIKLQQAIKNSFASKKGVIFMFLDGVSNFEKPLNSLESINYFNSSLVDFVKKDTKDIFKKDYNEKKIIISFTKNGNAVKATLDPSRFQHIDFFENDNNSFAQKILPFSDIMEGVIFKIEKILALESSLIYKSTTHNSNPEPAIVEAFFNNMSSIRNNIKNGNIAIIPEKDNLINFPVTTNLSALFESFKDCYSAIVGIPSSILFGENKGGLNSGRSKILDFENFMGDVKGFQNKVTKNIIKKFASVILPGKKILDININQLGRTTDKEESSEFVEFNKHLIELTQAGIISDEDALENLKGLRLKNEEKKS